MKGTERFESTNYEKPCIWYQLDIVAIVQGKGKGKGKGKGRVKSIPVRTWEVLCFTGIWSSHFWKQSAHESGKNFSHTRQLLLHPRNIPVTHFC
jgi:hypothetical protein